MRTLRRRACAKLMSLLTPIVPHQNGVKAYQSATHVCGKSILCIKISNICVKNVNMNLKQKMIKAENIYSIVERFERSGCSFRWTHKRKTEKVTQRGKHQQLWMRLLLIVQQSRLEDGATPHTVNVLLDFFFKLRRTCALKEIPQEEVWRYMARAKSGLEPTGLFSVGTLEV